MAFKTANLALRFVLELCALAALAYWGFQTGETHAARIVLGVGAPVLAAILWGTYISPRAAVAVSPPVHLLLEVIVFGLACAGLLAAGRPILAWILGLAFVINRALISIWGQSNLVQKSQISNKKDK